MIQTIMLQQAGGFDMSSGIMLIAFVAVFYFFIIRPQAQRQKKEKKFQETIKKGTQVIMSSGIHGRILETNESNKTVVVETGGGKIRFERSAISMDLTNNLTASSQKK